MTDFFTRESGQLFAEQLPLAQLATDFGTPLYDNGPIVNSPGTGPAGEDESILQTSLTLTLSSL